MISFLIICYNLLLFFSVGTGILVSKPGAQKEAAADLGVGITMPNTPIPLQMPLPRGTYDS